jgi:hypothetical protein
MRGVKMRRNRKVTENLKRNHKTIPRVALLVDFELVKMFRLDIVFHRSFCRRRDPGGSIKPCKIGLRDHFPNIMTLLDLCLYIFMYVFMRLLFLFSCNVGFF